MLIINCCSYVSFPSNFKWNKEKKNRETFLLTSEIIFSFKRQPLFSVDLSYIFFFYFNVSSTETPGKRNINQASMGRTSEPALGNVRPIGLKAFSLHEMLSNSPRRPADATLNWPSRLLQLLHTNLHKAFVGRTPMNFAILLDRVFFDDY